LWDSPSIKSTKSTIPGYEWLSYTSSIPNQEYILGSVDPRQHHQVIQNVLRSLSLVPSVVLKAVARQHRERHKGLYSEDEKLACKEELKQDGQWSRGSRFAYTNTLGWHFSGKAGHICIKRLSDSKKNIVLHRIYQPLPKELASADESGNYTLPATLLV